ncbi:efflux RND transporter periplasmic adaptor subunit [Flavicella sp.]|uniref:efflux RND transporter periplasmic adaptor subunit n=1 Tax=Flavicella sp. TaxID=2957742 RepID=UPI00301B1AD1
MKIYKVAIAISIGFILQSCKEKVAEKKEVLRPIRYEVVGTVNQQRVREYSGIAKASDQIDLSFRSSGIITELNIAVGMKVKKGDLLAKLDNVQAKLAYEQAISALSSARSAKNMSISNLERIKTLYAKGSNSLSDYEMAKNNYQSNLDKYESSKRNISIQKSQINYGYIYAAKDGVIASKIAELNENASAGQIIGVLNAGLKTDIMVGIPENVINMVFLGMETTLTFSSIEGKKFKGEIIEISPIANENSASYPVKIDVIDGTKNIKSGMTVDVAFMFSKSIGVSNPNTLIIPVKSVGENGDGNFVFVIESKDDKVGTVRKKTITIGELTVDGFIVKEGLVEGDKIATAGLQSLLNGQRVKLD